LNILKNLFSVLIFLSFSSNAQDTTFFDENRLRYSVTLDSSTTTTVHYPNGKLCQQVIYLHPNGPTSFEDIFMIERTELNYNENGEITASYQYLNNKLHGDYLMYDDSSFVTHLVFRNDSLVDIKNTNCCFVDNKGKIVTKEVFFSLLYTDEFGIWDYYLFEPWREFKEFVCCDFAFISEKYNWRTTKGYKKLVKRLKKNCS